MLRDITIGQYYQTDSVLHRLDPRVKVIGACVYMISLLCIGRMTDFLVPVLFFVLLLRLSKVPFRFVVRGLKPICLLLMFTAVLNLVFTPGITLWQFGVMTITRQGIRRSVFMVLRLSLLVLGTSFLTLTTTPNQLTDALEKLLKPLGRIGVPVHEVSMMMSIALRFIPILMEETERIMKAQMSRGADFEEGNLFQRMRNLLPLLVPLFVAAARRAAELAYAMDARCYHGAEGRTKMKPLIYQRRDAAGFVVVAGYLVLLCLLSLLWRARP